MKEKAEGSQKSDAPDLKEGGATILTVGIKVLKPLT